MALIYCYGENPLADGFAKETAETLVEVYPNHHWWVEVKGGSLIIKHMEASGQRCLIGMVKHLSQLNSGYAARRKDVITAAGELLERAYLPRGPRGDDPVTQFDADGLEKYWHKPLHLPKIH